MLPAGLVWGRPEVACGGSGSYAAMLAATASGSCPQQLVCCYTQPSHFNGSPYGVSPTGAFVGGSNECVDMGFQIRQHAIDAGPSSIFQPYQLHQQQQQLMMATAAVSGGVQHKLQQQTTGQAVYHIPSAAASLGLQASMVLPYQLQSPDSSANGISIGGGLPPGDSALHLHHQNATFQAFLQQQLLHQQQHQSATGYLSPEHLFLNPAAFTTGQSLVGLEMTAAPTVGRKRSSNEMQSEPTLHDVKKVRLDSARSTNNRPTRVIQFCGLPSDVMESEILQLSLPFGSVSNVVIIKNKNQALVEMADMTSAHKALACYSQRAPVVRGHVINVQPSNHEHVSPEDPSLQDGDTGGALDGGGGGGSEGCCSSVDEPRTILRVIVENMLYPVNLDTLKQLFSRYGQVVKIVTFTKNGMLHALLQFSETSMAQSAKKGLNGQQMYSGCNLLRVDFSKLTDLSVRFNNEKTHDYSNPHLPTGESSSDHRTVQTAIQNQLSSTMLAGYGSVLAYTPGSHTSGMIPPPGTIFLAATPGAAATTVACSVLLVSNLNEEKVTPDALFTLFGVYGDVTRVKIMFNKKDTALVQFSDPGQAQIAMNNLDKVKLWGKQIKVTPSKHNIVQMPKEGQPDAGLTKDYSNSPLHRFKKPNSKNYNNIFPPSATLHLSNIPGTTKERLTELFSAYGVVAGFKFFQKDCKMALLQMNSVDEAAEALMAMHNFQLAETSHLRVSFSKSTVVPQTVGDNQ